MQKLTKAIREVSLRLAVGFPALFEIDAAPIPSDSPNDIPVLFAIRVVKVLGGIAIPLGIAAVIYSSYLLITSAGNPDATAKAKKNLGYVIMGFLCIIFARVAYNFLTGIF